MSDPSSVALSPVSSGRSVPVALLLLAGPMIASMISRTIMSFVDFVMVSRLGTEHQAAILPAGMMLFTIIAVGIGMINAVSTFVSQSYGRGNLSDCSSYAWQGIYLSFIGGLALLPAWWFVEPMFAWIGHDANVQSLETVYTKIGLLGLGPTIAAMALGNFFNGIHKPAINMFAAVACNIFNVIANFALIYGMWGFPAMGMAGAAWATLLASILQVLLLMGWMLSPHYRDVFKSSRTWRFNPVQFIRLVKVGFPIGVQFGVDILMWTVFTTLLVGRFGTAQLAANNICFKFMEVSFMPTVGLGAALSAAVGKSIGMRRHDLARKYTDWALLFGVLYMGLVGLILFLCRYPLMNLLTDDPQVIEWGVKIMIFVAIFQIFDAMTITYTSALRGAGDTVWPAVASVLFVVVMFLGGSMLAVYYKPQWQSLGPWGVAAAYITVLGIVFCLRFFGGAWKKIDLIGPAVVDERV